MKKPADITPEMVNAGVQEMLSWPSCYYPWDQTHNTPSDVVAAVYQAMAIAGCDHVFDEESERGVWCSKCGLQKVARFPKPAYLREG